MAGRPWGATRDAAGPETWTPAQLARARGVTSSPPRLRVRWRQRQKEGVLRAHGQALVLLGQPPVTAPPPSRPRSRIAALGVDPRPWRSRSTARIGSQRPSIRQLRQSCSTVCQGGRSCGSSRHLMPKPATFPEGHPACASQTPSRLTGASPSRDRGAARSGPGHGIDGSLELDWSQSGLYDYGRSWTTHPSCSPPDRPARSGCAWTSPPS